MKKLLPQVVIIGLLSGCDLQFKVDREEESSEKRKTVDVYCTPSDLNDQSRGFDIVINESAEEATVWVRAYTQVEKSDGSKYWNPKWLEKSQKTSKVARGNDRIFFLEGSIKPILRQATFQERIDYGYDGGVEWMLYAGKPDQITHLCYASANLTKDLYFYLYNSRPILNLDSFRRSSAPPSNP